nr:hypothetical protein [uncultured Albidiferax sp.]
MITPPEKRAAIHRQVVQKAQALRREAMDHAWRSAGEWLGRAARAAWLALSALGRNQRR